MNTPTADSQKLQTLRNQLKDENGLRRQEGRMALIRMGYDAVPILLELLDDKNEHARWEATEALVHLPSPAAAPKLVELLQDESSNVRWAAIRALIAQGRAGLPALLDGLVRHFGSVRLRDGAHHVLHALSRKDLLTEPETHVFELLNGRVPVVTSIPWAAEAALEAMRNPSDESADA